MSKIGFGAAPLAFRDISADEAVATIHAALDHGVRLIDTALAYTRPGLNRAPGVLPLLDRGYPLPRASRYASRNVAIFFSVASLPMPRLANSPVPFSCSSSASRRCSVPT